LLCQAATKIEIAWQYMISMFFIQFGSSMPLFMKIAINPICVNTSKAIFILYLQLPSLKQGEAFLIKSLKSDQMVSRKFI
jgi:hypothetical protein